jgi:hypothetical protein
MQRSAATMESAVNSSLSQDETRQMNAYRQLEMAWFLRTAHEHFGDERRLEQPEIRVV